MIQLRMMVVACAVCGAAAAVADFHGEQTGSKPSRQPSDIFVIGNAAIMLGANGEPLPGETGIAKQ